MSETTSVAEFAPPDCAVCTRSLLVGENVQIFQDPSGGGLVKVCELCRQRAIERGFETLAFDSKKLRVHASGSVRDVVDRDALIEGLGNELAYLRQQLGAAEAALLDQNLQEKSVRAITDRLRRQERELERLRKEVAPAQQLQDTVTEQTRQLRELREGLRARDEQVGRLQAARIAESQPLVMCRHALDAFNTSEHADRMSRIARTLGDPEAWVLDLGPSVPRRIKLTLAWDIAWYEFMIKLDLGTARASVQETDTGGDPSRLPRGERTATVLWRQSGLVLAAS